MQCRFEGKYEVQRTGNVKKAWASSIAFKLRRDHIDGDHAGLQVILTSSGGRNGAWLLLEERHLLLASNLQTIAASPTQIWEFEILQIPD